MTIKCKQRTKPETNTSNNNIMKWATLMFIKSSQYQENYKNIQKHQYITKCYLQN